MNKALFVVLYPYKFTEFLWRLMELDYFESYCDVLVLDVSSITAPQLSEGVSAERSRNSKVVAVSSWTDFVRRIHDLRTRAIDTNICVQNVVPYSSFSGLACNLIITILLKGKGVAIFDLFISGTPVYRADAASSPNEATRIPGLLVAVRRFFKHTTTPLEGAKKLSGLLLSSLSRLLPSALTHRLVAGQDWEILARATPPAGKRVTLVYGHSYDYSNNLIEEQHSIASAPPKKTAVLLDAAGPMFGDDYIYLGRKAFLTSDVWYPALTRFFDRLEAETGVRIEIAGHYKSAHPPVAPHFGNRRVHYGMTRELVHGSEFVMTRQSAAVAYAVMYRKPIIFIYSTQMKDDLRAMRGTRNLAGLFGAEPVNIDEPLVDIGALLKVDEDLYAKYEKACLTSDPARRPNSRVILEDIMRIAVNRKSEQGF